MNGKTGGDRGPRRAGALAVVTAATLLAAGCGMVHVSLGGSGSASSGSSASAGAPTYAQELALAGCMRGHGVPSFPDPNTSGGYTLTSNGTLEGDGGSIAIDGSQVQAAYGDCRHLLPNGPSISQLEQDVQQEQQRQAQMLPLLVKYSQCMRSHGLPSFPDPGQSTPSAGGAPINVNSPQYATAAGACQQLLPAGDHVTIHQSTQKSTQKPAS